MSSEVPVTVKFDDKTYIREYNAFTEEFFGGSDVSIYINGKRVESISGIQFTVQEQQKPIYGYGSRTFDDLAVGSRVVVGAIKVPLYNTEKTTVFEEEKVIDNRTLNNKISAPSWVYNYKPQVAKSISSNQNEESDNFQIISRIQKSLGLEQNGFLDINTKNAILEYRKNNSMTTNVLIDNELLTKLNVINYEKIATKDYTIYDSPTKDKVIGTIYKDSKYIEIATSNDMLLVKSQSGITGYIEKV